MEELFGEANIIAFLERVQQLIVSQNNQVKLEIQSLEDQEEISDVLRQWKISSGKEYSDCYAQLKPKIEGVAKPSYEQFMFNISKEFDKNEDFREKINAIGEAIVDLKETLKSKIQDQISIYKSSI